MMFWFLKLVFFAIITFGKQHKMTVKFVKSTFLEILIFGELLATQNVKCISFNNQPCLVSFMFIEFKPSELHYYSFVVSLDRCIGNFNT